ncbi:MULTISPECIES: hypothetical protein [Lysinibacillus]|uniref:hypothetical protein n=1 Tax=Lysinibacillus TaxID=400634 RepID=UPI002579D825|nr:MULTISPECIES: hypothetical protein [Lysinibacillus]
MKKSTILFSILVLLLTFSMGAYAATKYNFTFDGKKQSVDVQIINKKAYVPLDAIVGLYGDKVTYDSKSNTYAVTSNATGSTTTTTQSELSQTIKNVTVKIDKVVQDSDSLKIYVTYVNNSNDKISNGSDLSKIVANGNQYSYNFKFNFERYNKKENVPHADTYIEPGVTAEDVIFYAPVDADSINILIRANWTDYRFNNVKITK